MPVADEHLAPELTHRNCCSLAEFMTWVWSTPPHVHPEIEMSREILLRRAFQRTLSLFSNAAVVIGLAFALDGAADN